MALQSFGQRTFYINKNEVGSLVYQKFKVFLVSNNVEIDFVGRKISASKRFIIDTLQAKEVELAIEQQYKDACMRQLYRQYNDKKWYNDSSEWKKSVQYYKKHEAKFEKASLKDQQERLHKYDRYFWGYFNDYNEKIIRIRFDPHKIKWYTIPGTGESHINVLTILVYNRDYKQ